MKKNELLAEWEKKEREEREHFFEYGFLENRTLWINSRALESPKMIEVMLKRIEELPIGYKFEIGVGEGFVLEDREVKGLLLNEEETKSLLYSVNIHR